MNGAIKVVFGLLVIIAGLYIYLSGWFNGFFAHQFMNALKLVIGNIPGLIILIGLVMLLLGISDARN